MVKMFKKLKYSVFSFRSVMSKVRQFNSCSFGAENKENHPMSAHITKSIYSTKSQTTPSIVLSQESDSDTDSDGTINWRDYYGDDEHGLCLSSYIMLFSVSEITFYR